MFNIGDKAFIDIDVVDVEINTAWLQPVSRFKLSSDHDVDYVVKITVTL